MSEYQIAGGIPITWLLSVSGIVLGGVFGLLKWFAGRMIDEIETRLKQLKSRHSVAGGLGDCSAQGALDKKKVDKVLGVNPSTLHLANIRHIFSEFLKKLSPMLEL